MIKKILAFLLVLVAGMFTQAQPGLSIRFDHFDTSFTADAKEYQKIWKEDGKKIIRTMEQVSRLKFIDTAINVIVLESPSNSGDNIQSPLKLRASYVYDTKKAALIHELGHRLFFAVKNFPPTYNEHNALFLFLYDVWVTLYGQKFADEQVLVEEERSNPRNDYRTMWQTALSMSKEERKTNLKRILEKYK